MTTKRSCKLQELVCHGSQVTCATFGPKTGQVMATGGQDGKVNTWHVGSPKCILSLSPLSSSIEAVRFSGSEELVCAGSISGSIRLWDLSASKVLRHVNGHKSAVRSVNFHPYADYFVSCSDDHSVKMWDFRKKQHVFKYMDHVDSVNCVQFSPDGKWVASGSADKTCKVWDITAGKLVHNFKDHQASVTCMYFHPCEKLLATGSADRTCKLYDVETCQDIFSTGLESNPILQVIISENDQQVITASQDCCKFYSRSGHLDTELVKWGKPADVIIANNKLMGCSFLRNVVSVHVVDLQNFPQSGHQIQPLPPSENTSSSKVKGSISSRVVKSKPTFSPFEKKTHITTRPHTNCGVTTGIAANFNILPKELQVNNNSTLKIDENNEKSIFNPTSTLAHSPLKENERGNLPPQPPLKNQPSPNVAAPSQTTTVAKNLLNNQQLPDSHCEPNINRLVIHHDLDITTVPTIPNFKPKVVPNVAHKEEPKSTPLGGALNWNDTNQIPTRDCDVTEIPMKSIAPSNDGKVYPEEPKAASTAGLATVVPVDSNVLIGLDMKAFLPVKHEPLAFSSPTKSDTDVFIEIRKGLDSMRTVMTNRHKNLEIVRALWSTGDVMTSINQAVKVEDQSLIVDLLNVLVLKSSLWSLDLCVAMLPQMKSLVSSKYESYITVGCSSLKLLLKNFGQVIRSNVATPPSTGVDISREERHSKCKNCFKYLNEIKEVLDGKQNASGKVGSQFRELKILLSTIE